MAEMNRNRRVLLARVVAGVSGCLVLLPELLLSGFSHPLREFLAALAIAPIVSITMTLMDRLLR